MAKLKDQIIILDTEEGLNEHSEQSICIYTTSRGEKLVYYWDGRGYIDDSGRQLPYVWTRVIDQNGDEIMPISIKEIWDMFYELSEKDTSLVACVALVYYHLQQKKELKNYKTVLTKDINGCSDLRWRLPRFDDDIIRSLNEMIGDISIGNRGSISFEGFIYYWELEFIRESALPQKEKFVFHDKRLEMFKTIIWLAGYYMGAISYGDLLYYIKDWLPGTMGVDVKLISAATKGSVHYALTDLKQALKEEGIEFLEKSSMMVGRVYISYLICIPKAKVIVLQNCLADYKKRRLEKTEWRTISIKEIRDLDSFNRLLQFIKSSIR